MIIERHNVACGLIVKAISKGSLAGCWTSCLRACFGPFGCWQH